MADPTLTHYGFSDDSSNTSLRVCGHRTLSPRGTLLHTTSGTDSLQWLQGGSAIAGSPASSDVLIARSGYRHYITPDGRYAYHAGVSTYTLDRVYHDDEVSQVLVGIELECLDVQVPTFEQLDSLGECIAGLAALYGWRWPFIILGHYAVARPLGRRSDPVNLDWGWLMGRIYVRTLDAGIPGLVKG